MLELPDLTAVFVANDQMALGLLRALHENGLAVPGDVSVVGFDDIPEAEFFTPPLTTVHQDFSEMGRRSLHLLVERIGAPESSAAHEIVPAELVVRSSTGPLAGAR
jgi:DNA-binding LacI/PurR family transcriptional regulator